MDRPQGSVKADGLGPLVGLPMGTMGLSCITLVYASGLGVSNGLVPVTWDFTKMFSHNIILIRTDSFANLTTYNKEA